MLSGVAKISNKKIDIQIYFFMFSQSVFSCFFNTIKVPNHQRFALRQHLAKPVKNFGLEFDASI